NRLVLSAGLSARQVALLRAYQMYYSQLNLVTSRGFVTNALLAHPDVARLLLAYFETRFDPTLGVAEAGSSGAQAPDTAAGRGGAASAHARAARRPRLESAGGAVLEALADVSSLDEGQSLRGLLDLMRATVRTNYDLDAARISFKLDSAQV